MLASACAIIASCESGENETEAPTNAEGSTDSETDSGEDESDTNEDETVPDIEGVEYEDGASIADAGTQWDEEVFAGTVNEIDESKAVTKTADEIIALLTNKDLMAEGEVYRVTETIVLESNTKYYGNLAAIIAEGGIVIKDATKIVVKELVVKGKVTVENSDNITFFKLDLKGGDVGVTVDASSNKIAFKSCQIRATDIAIKTDATGVSVFQNYISANSGIVSTGDNLSVQDTRLDVVTVGVSTNGEYCTVKNCLVNGNGETVGISMSAGSVNGLIALNTIKTAQDSIILNDCFNCVVLLNSAVKVTATNSKNVYVVENKLGGAITIENSRYLLCDGNTFPNDGKPHPVINTNNTDYNGDNLHNVNERVDYGANEELLPHTNKDLFLDMDRHSSVTDISLTKSYSIGNYIRTMARQKSIVIVPPGAYTVDTKIQLEVGHANTTLYGYGVYIEKNGRELVNNNGVLSQDGTVFAVYNSKNITVKGVTIGYNFQSAGQIHVLEKLGDYKLRVIGNAGYLNDFYLTDKTMFASSIYCYKKGEFRPWLSLSGYAVITNPDGSVQRDEDGAFIISIKNTSNSDRVYKLMEVGDIFSCRLSADNSRSISLSGSNILLKDSILYGYSSALGIVAGSRSTGVRLERLHNTAHSQPVIDQATYDKYKALEEKYNVNLEVSIDEEGRYRGGYPRQGSVDATHITGASEGVSATSCTFELMCDDGSNQRGSSSRIAGYKVNDDGTTTIYIKGTISQTYWNLNTNASKTTASPTNTSSIKQGDRVYAYASNGRVLFDTTALTAAKAVTYSPEYHVAHLDKLDNSTIGEGGVTLSENNGHFTQPSTCVDGLCDVCGDITHYDCNRDGKCDLCQTQLHVDWDRSGKCDVSTCTCQLVDADGDHKNDKDGVYIILDRFHVSSYSTSSGQLSVTAGYNRNGWLTITYNTSITEINVKTSEVNFEAFEGYDLDDNEYLMDHKILIDNLSANSVGFTFDNVLIQNKNARGILGKTHDIVIKNCTFRGFSSTGVLLSVETTWGESTVPRNVLVERCLFDDTGRNYDTESNTTYSCIAIQGLGANSSSTFEPSEDTLPCRDIRIIGNKFINTNNNYAISVSAAQDIIIKDNIFEARPEDTERRYGRAVYIDGAMNIEISGNTYSVFAGGDVSKAVIGWNYKNLHGTDVDKVLPVNKDPKPAT